MDGKIFVLMIIGMSMVGWWITTWIRAKHGYPVENEWGGMVENNSGESGRQIALLSNENADLKGKIVRMEERVAVLERIVTDKSHSLAAEIDALR